jgi:VanZ family protein
VILWRTFVRYWLPVVLWAALIFSASSDAGSSGRTSRFIRPLLLWLKPDLSDTAVDGAVYVIRKAAHVAEYAVLAALLWRALRGRQQGRALPWDWRLAAQAFGLVAAYAASDELHQIFVPTREGRIRDVLYDSAGAAMALLVLWAWDVVQRRRGCPARGPGDSVAHSE